MRVVSFDFGHTNLAMVCANVDEVSYDVDVTFAKMTNLKHIQCRGDCFFQKKDRRSAHLLHHFVESIDEHLKKADLVLGELQPIMGMTDIEQCMLIYIQQRYSNGNKKFMQLISPNTLHTYFKMSSDKVTRRLEIVELMEYYLRGHRAYEIAKHKDHLSDACGFIILYAETILPDFLRRDMKINRFGNFAFDS